MRLRYAKRGRLRFSSHRDFQRAFERALRRADVPVAYSAGFTPHPRVSYAGASPTGVASEAEYLEVSLIRRVDPRQLCEALDRSLPPGLDVLEIVEAGPGALADRLQASVWEVRLPGADGDAAIGAVQAFLARDVVEVERLTKNGIRTFDVRAAVTAIDVVADAGAEPTARVETLTGRAAPVGAAGVAGIADRCAILHMVVRHTTPSVRPDDVLSGLRHVAAFAPPEPPAVTRLAQGPLGETWGAGGLTGMVADPLDPDRAAAGGPDHVPQASGPPVEARPGLPPGLPDAGARYDSLPSGAADLG